MERSLLSYPQRNRDHVLLIGDDLDLLNTRRMVLESAGHQVRCLPSCKTCEGSLNPGIDLVVLCHSIKGVDVKRIVAALRRCDPHIPLLLLVNAESSWSERLDGIATSIWYPEVLLEAVAQLTSARGKPATRVQARSLKIVEQSHMRAS
jgi:DNA-binding NtrC family response regulator